MTAWLVLAEPRAGIPEGLCLSRCLLQTFGAPAAGRWSQPLVPDVQSKEQKGKRLGCGVWLPGASSSFMSWICKGDCQAVQDAAVTLLNLPPWSSDFTYPSLR